MPNFTEQAQEAVQGLQGQDEEELYRLLGTRLAQIEQNPQVAGYFTPPASFAEPMGMSVQDMVALGRRAFGGVGKLGYEVVCGGGNAAAGGHMQQLMTTFGQDPVKVASTVALILGTTIGITPAVAGIVATIIVGKVAPQSLDSLCKVWQTKIA